MSKDIKVFNEKATAYKTGNYPLFFGEEVGLYDSIMYFCHQRLLCTLAQAVYSRSPHHCPNQLPRPQLRRSVPGTSEMSEEARHAQPGTVGVLRRRVAPANRGS